MQSNETHTEKSTGKVYHVHKDSSEAIYQESDNEVDRMVTAVDFERRFPNPDHCRLQ
jgi:hypothetical protein